MSFLSLMEAKLPPGFRFQPKDEELVLDYLAKKVAGDGSVDALEYPTIMEVDLNKIEPWDLPEMACVGGKEWYFFSLRDRKYATGPRTNRSTISGYWKATGKDRKVRDNRRGTLVGMRKTLVFYQGRAPRGKKSDWVMHEFRLEGPHNPSKDCPKEDRVLCRVFYKNRGKSEKIMSSEEESNDDDSGSSVPPLMDNNLVVTFDQTPLGFEGSEQVPCFSHFSQVDQTSNLNQVVEPNSTNFGQPLVPQDITTSYSLEYPLSLSYEKELVMAVLDHYNKMETNMKRLDMVSSPSSFHDPMTSDPCYFSDPLGLSSLWSECLF